jgi:hypothetical protein
VVTAKCQRGVSAALDGGGMPTQSRDSDDPAALVAAALYSPDAQPLLDRAAEIATTTRDRQLVAIAAAHLRGERDVVDALARDHLVDHPDSVLAAWIAGLNKERP